MASAIVDLPETPESLASNHAFIVSKIGAVLARCLTRLCALASNVALDVVEDADPRQHLGGDGRRRVGLDVEELATHMRPTIGERHLAVLPGKRFVSAIAIDLEQSLETGQMLSRPLVLAIGLVDIGHARRLGR